MSIETVEQVNKAFEEVSSASKSIDALLEGDLSGFSTLVLVLLFIVFFRPIMTLAVYGVAIFLIFAAVKTYG